MDMDELGSLRNMTRQNGHGYVANCYDDQVVVAMVIGHLLQFISSKQPNATIKYHGCCFGNQFSSMSVTHDEAQVMPPNKFNIERF